MPLGVVQRLGVGTPVHDSNPHVGPVRSREAHSGICAATAGGCYPRKDGHEDVNGSNNSWSRVIRLGPALANTSTTERRKPEVWIGRQFSLSPHRASDRPNDARRIMGCSDEEQHGNGIRIAKQASRERGKGGPTA